MLLNFSLSSEIQIYAMEVKTGIKEMLKEKEKEGLRFSHTTDEWSSKANKKFSSMNVHLPGGLAIRLGMVRIKESFPAEKAVELFRQKLEEFDLKVEQQFGISTDGASLMKKMGSLLKIYHQLCHAHGLHLAGRRFNVFFNVLLGYIMFGNWQGTFKKCLSYKYLTEYFL